MFQDKGLFTILMLSVVSIFLSDLILTYFLPSETSWTVIALLAAFIYWFIVYWAEDCFEFILDVLRNFFSIIGSLPKFYLSAFQWFRKKIQLSIFFWQLNDGVLLADGRSFQIADLDGNAEGKTVHFSKKDITSLDPDHYGYSSLNYAVDKIIHSLNHWRPRSFQIFSGSSNSEVRYFSDLDQIIYYQTELARFFSNLNYYLNTVEGLSSEDDRYTSTLVARKAYTKMKALHREVKQFVALFEKHVQTVQDNQQLISKHRAMQETLSEAERVCSDTLKAAEGKTQQIEELAEAGTSKMEDKILEMEKIIAKMSVMQKEADERNDRMEATLMSFFETIQSQNEEILATQKQPSNDDTLDKLLAMASALKTEKN